MLIWITKLQPWPHLLRHIRKIHIFPVKMTEMQTVVKWNDRFPGLRSSRHQTISWPVGWWWVDFSVATTLVAREFGGEMAGYRFPPLPFLFWLLSRVTAELYTLLLRQKQHWIGGQQLGRLLCSARRWWYGTKLENRWNKSLEFCPKLQSHAKTSCIVFGLLLTLTVGLTAFR